MHGIIALCMFYYWYIHLFILLEKRRVNGTLQACLFPSSQRRFTSQVSFTSPFLQLRGTES